MNRVSATCLTVFLMNAALIAAGFSGCSSIGSTMLERSADNLCWSRGPRSQGVPITLKVPTHLRVEILEKQFLELVETPPDEGEEDSQLTIQPVHLDVPVRAVSTQVIKTEKIFTVDPKRPAAGVLASTLDFQGQYFKQIKYRNEDQTLDTINRVISSLASPGGILGGQGTSTAQSDLDKNLLESESVVASALFEIDDPDFENQLKAFLDRHLTGCHACHVVPPGVVPRKVVEPQQP